MFKLTGSEANIVQRFILSSTRPNLNLLEEFITIKLRSTYGDEHPFNAQLFEEYIYYHFRIQKKIGNEPESLIPFIKLGFNVLGRKDRILYPTTIRSGSIIETRGFFRYCNSPHLQAIEHYLRYTHPLNLILLKEDQIKNLRALGLVLEECQKIKLKDRQDCKHCGFMYNKSYTQCPLCTFNLNSSVNRIHELNPKDHWIIREESEDIL